jgi:galactokinase
MERTGVMDTTDEIYAELKEGFEASFGSLEGRRVVCAQAPGRSEIAGNHTDHEGGSVIAAAVDRYVRGIFSPNELGRARVMSEGYGLVDLELDDLSPREDERNSTASLVRGMAALMADWGATPVGFDAYLRSDVPAGSGLSSSAAFELELACAMGTLWGVEGLTAVERAVMAQRVEREWFGKPCGLMDQAASSLGGVQHMSFPGAGRIIARGIDVDFAELGYQLVIVGVGVDHAANTDDYAAVPQEMQAVAREFGAERLGEIPEVRVLSSLPNLRRKLGDRPVLRALHYFREERLVAERAKALRDRDMQSFLALTRASGASSAMYLQNVSIAASEEQPAMVALAAAEALLAARGAARIHGGGFGGTIQCFVPTEDVDAFVEAMELALGVFDEAEESKKSSESPCQVMKIDHEGAHAWWL